MIQLFRRIIQLVVVLFVILIPFLSMQDSNLLQQLPVPKGSPWSITIFGYKISHPLSVLGSIFAGREVHIPLLLTAIPLIILTILLGRVFCGWLCPIDLLLEFNDRLRRFLKKAGLNPYNVAFDRLNKYMVLGCVLFLSAAFGMQVIPLIYPPAIIGKEAFSLTFYHTLGKGAYLILLILILEMLLSRRWWCRYICPGGALLSLMGKSRLLVIRGNREACINCLVCTEVCPLGLDPMRDAMGMECSNCGQCISKCPKKAFNYSMGFAG